jgi:hypothetical protein
MVILLVIWGGLLSALVIFAIGRSARGGALTLAYFLSLSLVHVPGVLPLLEPGSGLLDEEETGLGFEMTIHGMAAFVVGAVLACWINRRRLAAKITVSRGRASGLDRLGKRAFLLGIVAQFVFLPLVGRIPSLTSIVAPVAAFMILGLWLALYEASVAADTRRILGTLALLPVLPLATLITGGFLGFGVNWDLSILAFLFVITKRRIWFYSAAPAAIFFGLSLFVTYMGERVGIREDLREQRASVFDRLDRASAIFTNFQLLDWSSPTQIGALGRLNQNSLEGAGIIAHEYSGVPFANGATVPVWALIPRAVWPGKPDVGGGGNIVADFLGIHIAEGTSMGPGNVLEFYINFGLPGVLIGFLGLGYLLMWLDQGTMRSLAVNDIRGVLMRAMPGLMLLQPLGNLIEILVAFVAACIVAHLAISLPFFDIALAPRSRRRVA